MVIKKIMKFREIIATRAGAVVTNLQKLRGPLQSLNVLR
jgi:hypothetical protein